MKENKSEQTSEVSNENRLKKFTVIEDIKQKRSLKNDSTKFQRRHDLRIIWSSVNLANKGERAPENKYSLMISL